MAGSGTTPPVASAGTAMGTAPAGGRVGGRIRSRSFAASLGFVVSALLVFGAACSLDGQPVSDELSDFSTTTTEPEPIDPSRLYGRYADEASDSGLTPLGASEADERASYLCFDQLTAAQALEDAGDAVTHDVLVIRTWCPHFDEG